MIYILEVILCIAIFMTIYLIITRPNKLEKKMIKGLNEFDGKEGNIKTNEEKLKELITKIPFYKTQEQLDSTGNKLHLSPIKYLIYKYTIAFMTFMISLEKTSNIFIIISVTLIGFFAIDIYLKRGKSNERDLIRLDLEDFYRSLKIKDRRNTKVAKAIEEAAGSVVRCQRFREELMATASTIKLTGQYESALEDLGKKFNYSEIRHFIKAIKSYKQTGKLDYSIDGQLNQLEKKNDAYNKIRIYQMREKADSFRYIFFIGAAMLVILAISVMIEGILVNFL